MITQKCDQSIVQNAERNLFIKIQENDDLLRKRKMVMKVLILSKPELDRYMER